MSKQTNPALIGAFVVGAVTLLAIAVAVFGGADLLARKTMLVTYFDGSVQGLREGSNVVFRGVRVGSVETISLLTDVETLSPKIEVVMRLRPDAIKVLREGRRVEGALDGLLSIDELVKAGFSAQLDSESFVTGQLLVDLDFRPGQALELYDRNSPYPEIPSVPSDIQQAIQKFQTVVADIQRNVDFGELSTRLLSVLRGFDELVNSQDVRDTLAGVNRLVNADDTQQLSASAQATLAELRRMVAEAKRLFDSVDDDVDQLVRELKPVARRLDQAISDAQATLGAAKGQLEGDSPQVQQLQATLTEVEAAARTLRAFFDYLERHPEALLRGKAE
ncbi:MAG: MlaD family protein [Pseudomonadales bacterium]